MADSSKDAAEGDTAKSDPKKDKLFSKFLSEVSATFIISNRSVPAPYPNILVHNIS